MSELNIRGGVALVKNTWSSWMQYRSFFFILAFGWMVPPLASMFVWMTAGEDAPIRGFTGREFIGYYLVLILVNQLTYAQSNWTLGDVIRLGDLNFWLMKPMPVIWNLLSSEIAGKVVTLVFVLPITAILAVVLHPEIHTSPGQVFLFVLSLWMAWALRFLWGYSLALLAFWSNRADGLLTVQDALVFLFSGILAPITLLPGILQNVALGLPFRYMVGYPIEVLLQSLPQSDLLAGFLFQSGWLLFAVGTAILLWKSGIRRYHAQGG
jgi:ABC-2 type transport system permease protein